VVRGNLWLVFAGGTLLALVFALLGPQMVTWFFGPEYHLRPLASALIGLLAILVGISNAFGTQGLVANGREFHVALVIAIGALVAVFGHSYWVPRYGAEGGIYAWIMAEFVVTVLSVFAYYQFQRS
jgi:O-antigen/teichoic acid export membrane protein